MILLIGDLMSTWKQVLEIEAKYGPLPGTQAKLPQIIQRLKNVINAAFIIIVIKIMMINLQSQRNDSDVRMVLYYLLSSEGSLESQQVILFIQQCIII